MGIMEKLVELETVFVLQEGAIGSNVNDLNKELLSNGWYVKSVTPMGMSGGSCPHHIGMAVVVLRKVNI